MEILTEAENAERELFGRERVTETITAFKDSPQELIETMTAAVHQYVGDYEQSDDLTMLAFRLSAQLSSRLIASLTCVMLLRETGSDSWQCLMSNWVEPECETICST